MNLIEVVKSDYQKFPQSQTYEIYAPDVFFKDPVYEFRGLGKYQKMIGFITYWFAHLKLELHEIYQQETIIHTQWTMSWNSPLPRLQPFAANPDGHVQLDRLIQLQRHLLQLIVPRVECALQAIILYSSRTAEMNLQILIQKRAVKTQSFDLVFLVMLDPNIKNLL